MIFFRRIFKRGVTGQSIYTPYLEDFHLLLSLLCISFSFAVFGAFSWFYLSEVEREYHRGKQRVAELAALQVQRFLDTERAEALDLFSKTGYVPIKHAQFQHEFAALNTEISEEYFQKIGTGKMQRYHTRWDGDIFLSRLIPKMQDDVCGIPGVYWAHIIDINGYVPWHSHTRPVTGDYEFDVRMNRTKRIFRKYMDYTVRAFEDPPYYYSPEYNSEISYPVTAWPIMVGGDLWGAFIMGYENEFDAGQKIEIMIYCLFVSCFLGVFVSFAAKKSACYFITVFSEDYAVRRRN